MAKFEKANDCITCPYKSYSLTKLDNTDIEKIQNNSLFFIFEILKILKAELHAFSAHNVSEKNDKLDFRDFEIPKTHFPKRIRGFLE